MYSYHGIGLAAPQVGVAVRAFVIDTKDGYDLKEFVNPRIISKIGTVMSSEGCLSLPGVVKNKKRSSALSVIAHDRHGTLFEAEFDGLLAIAVQHEIDHLDGVLMID